MPTPDRVPSCPSAPAFRSADRITRDYAIELITPMFGSGVEAGVPDPSLPIRGTSIRGQLQFWWRATIGARYATYQELYAAHAKIWGGVGIDDKTTQASDVSVEIADVKASAPRPCGQYRRDQRAGDPHEGRPRLEWNPPFAGSALPYALFPFQGEPPAHGETAPKKSPATFVETASFTLRLSYAAKHARDVETAVWAWVNFGGLGARTRRGCGALRCKEVAVKDARELGRELGARGANDPAVVRPWPILWSRVAIGAPTTEYQGWKQVIELLQKFRQDAGFARNVGETKAKPGRSLFPEPETIRGVFESRSGHRRRGRHQRMEHIPNDAFPRAEFGLPIIFHFLPEPGEPPDTALYPTTLPDGTRRDRMASPLILKPLALADGTTVPLILQLVTPPLTAVELRLTKPERRLDDQPLALPTTTLIRGERLKDYKGSPLAGSASGSALEAFWQRALDTKRFQEIKR